MRYLCTKAIAAVIFLGAGSLAAMAEVNYGPVRNGDQCFTKSAPGSEPYFGYWGPCSGTANSPNTATSPNTANPANAANPPNGARAAATLHAAPAVHRRTTVHHENRATKR